MFKTQLISDKLAMTLSFACTIHCFFVPSFIILTSGFLSFSIDNEFIHYSILLLAVPISFYALISGYFNHKTIHFLPVGITGLLVLTVAVLLGEAVIGELGEKLLTLFGSIMVIYAHYGNHRACKALDCNCHDQEPA